MSGKMHGEEIGDRPPIKCCKSQFTRARVKFGFVTPAFVEMNAKLSFQESKCETPGA